MYIRWLIFSCNLLSLYPAAHFLSMWFSGIMAIMNSRDDSASPLKMPLWIFVSAMLFLLLSAPLFRFAWSVQWSLWLPVIFFTFWDYNKKINSKLKSYTDKTETVNWLQPINKIAIQEYVWLGRKCYPLWILQNVKIDHPYKRYTHRLESVQENQTLKILQVFNIPTRHLLLSRRTHLLLIKKKKKTYRLVDYAVWWTVEWK